MLVVDANILIYLLTANARTAEARRVWEADHDWWAPRLLQYELTSVFARLVKERALSLEAGAAGLEAGIRLAKVPKLEPPAGRVLEIASKLRISAYDVAYLAVAEELGAPLLTEDRRLLGAAPSIARSLAGFA